MRNASWKLKALALAGTAALFAGTSQAASLNFGGYYGPIFIKYSNFDVGRIYAQAPGTTTATAPLVDLLPQTDAASPFAPVAGGGLNPVTGSTNAAEDTWGIAKVSEIHAGTDGFAPLIYQAGNPGFQGNTQITVIYFGGNDIQVTTDATGTKQSTAVNNIQLGFFASDVTNPLDGVNLSAAPTAAARGNGPISYPGITDGTLIFSFRGVAGSFADNPLAEQESNVDLVVLNNPPTGATVGTGSLFLDKSAIDFGSGPVTGTENGFIGSNVGPDASVQFTTRQGTRDWTVTSDDPALATVVPTPSSMAMGGMLMLGGLLMRSVRRSRKAQ